MACFNLEEYEAAKEAFEAGRSLTVPIMHASCWEIMTQVPSLFLFGHKPASIYQPLRNPYLNALVLRRREKLGYKLFDRQEGFNEPISHVRDMGILGIVCQMPINRYTQQGVQILVGDP